jgi:hypothetical protein
MNSVFGIIWQCIDLKFQAYPGFGHSLMDEELEYFSSWLRSRLLSSGAVQERRGCCSQM